MRLRKVRSKDHFSLKDELNKAVSTLTDAAQKKLKQKVNPDSPINPTDPALLPYNKETKNAVQVAQALPTEVSILPGVSNTHLFLIIGTVLLMLYLHFRK